MQQEQDNNNFDFITKGIYQPSPPSNFIYRIEDFIPLIVNNEPKIIGEGRFSIVYLYKHKNNESLFALKKVSIKKVIESGNDMNIIQREINIHSRINHENIVQFYSVSKGLNEINILLEYCRNGSIFELIEKNGFDELKTYKYFSQVVNAVYFLHSHNLVHRDIKPENILLNGDKIKLCDFGWCCETNTNNRKSFCGTFEYMAPEIIKEMPYGKPVDIWALGILLYELYFGFSPFNSNKENEEQTKDIINKIMQKKLLFNKKTISYDMKDLILHMLEIDAIKRYTINEVVSHPWFKKCSEKIKKTDTNTINNINNFEEIETNVTKVTKILKKPNDIWPNYPSNIYQNKTFINKGNNSYRNITGRPNYPRYNYYSNKSLNIKDLKNLKDFCENKCDDDEDGFSPFMKNGSIKIPVSLDNINRFNSDKNINFQINNNKNYYSNITHFVPHEQNKYNSNIPSMNNNFPMDNVLEETIRENKEISNPAFSSRISVTKVEKINKSNNLSNKKNLINRRMSSNQIYYQTQINNSNIINNNFYLINNNNQFKQIFY